MFFFSSCQPFWQILTKEIMSSGPLFHLLLSTPTQPWEENIITIVHSGTNHQIAASMHQPRQNEMLRFINYVTYLYSISNLHGYNGTVFPISLGPFYIV